MIEVVVARKWREAEGICGFELRPIHGGLLPAFTAGAHIDVELPGGLIRQYSLCNHPEERDRYRVAVLREVQSRGGSVAMHEALQEGSRLRISEPRNQFPLAEEDAPFSLLLAGGIGVTPLLSMAQQLHALGRRFEMHYCTRSPARTAFRDYLDQSPFASNVHFHHDDGAPEQRFNAERVLGDAPAGTHLYVCGPGGFIEHVLGTAADYDWPEMRLHREYFTASSAARQDDDSEFVMRIASSGERITVPVDRTALEMLEEAGIEVPFSCESGVCGTCLTPVLEGAPDHRDSVLSESERAANDCFTPCCSRALSTELLLDL